MILGIKPSLTGWIGGLLGSLMDGLLGCWRRSIGSTGDQSRNNSTTSTIEWQVIHEMKTG